MKELHRRPQWLRSRASPPPSTALRSPIGSSTEGPSGCTRMRLPTQYSTSRLHKELRRRSQWLHTHASPPP
eukprot:7923506-Pyramimonas_sp.AAC.1